jgi:hypothetical protein
MKNSRERLLALIVGCVAVLVAGFFTYSWVKGQFDRRARDITKLTSDIKKFERTAALGRTASSKISRYEQRSLPANADIARTRYQTWLVNEMESTGLIEPDVKFGTAQGGEKDIYIKQNFTVDAIGTLPQVVDLLHSFYSVDWLHRITRLSLKPIKDSKLLGITMQIETLSLKKANSIDKLDPIPSSRLALKSRDAYYDTIVGRNIFGPRNNEPKISISGSQDVFLGREVDLTIKGEDPDWLDQVLLNLVESAAPDAKLDPVTGKFTWKPTAEGKYEFTVEGTDDGFPSKVSTREKIVINVRPQGAPPPAAVFDVAKFTMLTALLDLDGQGEVWLHVRPTGQMVTLHEGDRFEIGTVKGTVSQIGEHDFCFDFEGKRRKLYKGELLDEAQVIEDAPQAASSSKPAAAEVEVQAKTKDQAS